MADDERTLIADSSTGRSRLERPQAVSNSRRVARSPEAAIGSVLLIGGSALLTVLLVEQIDAVPFSLPRIMLRQPELCGMLAAVATLGGAALLWRSRAPHVEWNAPRGGARFHSVVVYTKRDCPLCDEAIDVLRSYQQWLPALTKVDIEHDPKLLGRFAEHVPVIQFDGRVRFRGQINEVLLRRLIRANAPSPGLARRQGRR